MGWLLGSLDLQPFLHSLFLSPPLHFSILILGANCPTLFGLQRYLFDTLSGKKKERIRSAYLLETGETAIPLCSFFCLRFRRWCIKQPGTGQPQDPKKKKHCPLPNFGLSNELLHVVLVIEPLSKEEICNLLSVAIFRVNLIGTLGSSISLCFVPISFRKKEKIIAHRKRAKQPFPECPFQ